MKIALGLGSNVGERLQYIQDAARWISNHGVIENITESRIYESDAILQEGAPDDWDRPYLNRVVTGNTTLSASDLLHYVKKCESELGRTYRGVWAPREIDIDILAYGSQIASNSQLRVPHKWLLQRPFALVPMAEIWPGWIYPIQDQFYGKTAKELCHLLWPNGWDDMMRECPLTHQPLELVH